MSERWYPADSIGNRIRQGDLLHVTLPQSSALFHVTKVETASAIAGPDGKPMQINGKVTISCTFDIQYQPGRALSHCLVLKQPEEVKEIIAADKAALSVGE